MNQKGVAHILLLIVLLAGLVAGVYLVTSGNPLKLFSRASGDKLATVSSKVSYKGYIIEFTDNPVVSSSKPVGQKNISALSTYRETLKSKHQTALKDIFSRLQSKGVQDLSTNSFQTKALGEYTDVINGVALDITQKQAEQIKSSPFIKKIYPNLEVKTNLMDSVPLIKADQIWKMKDSRNNLITGKGIKIAVVDTGVDYTHPDLGASQQIKERDFLNIIPDSGRHLAISSDKSKFAFDKRAATEAEQPDKHSKIYVYTSTGQKLNEFTVPENEKWIAQIVIEGNFLAFFAFGDYGENAGVSTYNLTTGEHKRLSNTNVVGTMHIFENKLYFGTGRDSWSESNPSWDLKDVEFRMYDLLTDNSFTTRPYASPNNFYTIQSAFDKTRVAFPVPEKDGDLCAKNLYIFDLDKFQGQSYSPPEIGLVVDFKGDEILYIACNSANFDPFARSYYLFNIKTSVATKLTYSQDTGQTEAGGESVFNGLLTKPESISPKTSVFNWNRYSLGLIGDSIVYFRRNWLSDKIIIYNKSQKKYYRLNSIWPIGNFVRNGDMMCFSHSGGVYCHNYDSTSSYTLPRDTFNGKVISGYNFIYPDELSLDDFGHGTHVAAIAAGNGVLKGVAPDASIISYKVISNIGMGFISDILQAIDTAVQTRSDDDPKNDIDIMNFSLGANCYDQYRDGCGPDDILSKAVDNAVDTGIVMVIAAGNSGPKASTVNSPGTARKAITVGAVDKDKKIASFSSRGPVSIDNETLVKPDIVAPGVSICAAEWDSWLSSLRCQDDKHIAIGGTSMATPHVAGLVALIKQANPNLTPQQIKDILKSTAVNLNGYDQNTQGSGLVDAEAAIKSILEPRPPSLGGRACVQVITPARKESTGECRDFPTPCDVPSGWVKVDSCGVSDDISSPSPSPFSKLTPRGRVTPSVEPTVAPTSPPASQIKPASFPCTACLADINKDKVVNIADFSLWASCRVRGIKSSSRCLNADLDKNGKVGDSLEFKCITSQFGKKCKLAY